MGLPLREPWRAFDVDQAGCFTEDGSGNTLRKMEHAAAGEKVVKRIIINEEIGAGTFNNGDASGKPGEVERVPAINPPRIESSTSDVVGYGLASKPVTDLTQDALWRGMRHAMRNPAACGLKVDGVSGENKQGYMQRTMRILEKPGSPTVTDNIRVIESAQEITYKPVVNGVESGEERVFALRKDPLRMEMFSSITTSTARPSGGAGPQTHLDTSP